MRVITGTARGRVLETLPGEDTVRPTSLMVKEAIFSAVQFYVAGAQVLDVFAGSGQLGIEALSRGAQRCVFIDSSRDAVEIVKRNLKRTDLYAAASVIHQDAKLYLQNCRDRFDIVFMDPPYNTVEEDRLLALAAPCVADNGILLFETATDRVLPEQAGALVLKKDYKHGQTRVRLYRNERTEIESNAESFE